jgi:hypothetical protein
MLIAVGAHLLAHLRASIAALMDAVTIRTQELLSSRSLVAVSLLVGAVLAIASLFYVSPFSQAFAGR